MVNFGHNFVSPNLQPGELLTGINFIKVTVLGLLTLKSNGVTNNMLSLFYQSRILSILS